MEDSPLDETYCVGRWCLCVCTIMIIVRCSFPFHVGRYADFTIDTRSPRFPLVILLALIAIHEYGTEVAAYYPEETPKDLEVLQT